MTTSQTPAVSPQPRKRHRVRTVVLSVVGGSIALGVILSATSSHATPQPTTPPAPVTHSAPAAPAAPKATKAAKPVAPPAPAKPAITASQQQALDSAQSYVSDGQGFSRDGLISQLEFGKFSTADATWAADHSGANWDDQAVTSAKGYMSDGQGFSRQGLIDQLQFGKFTYAQASHAASVVGL